VGELVELEVDDQIATQEPVVEDEIEKVVIAVEGVKRFWRASKRKPLPSSRRNFSRWVMMADSRDVVGPAQGEGRFPKTPCGNRQFVRRLLTNLGGDQFPRRLLGNLRHAFPPD
jgi:hypothetical protein